MSDIKKNKDERASVVKVVAITVIALIALILAIWLVVVAIKKGRLKSAADEYVNTYLNVEYNIQEDELFGIDITKENEIEISNKISEVDNIVKEVAKQYNLDVDTDEIIGVYEYIVSYVNRDKEMLSSAIKEFESAGKTDCIDYKNVVSALNSLGDLNKLSKMYVETVVTQYVNDVTVVCGILAGEEAVDDLIDEYSSYMNNTVEYEISSSVLEMRQSVDNVVNDGEYKDSIVIYCDKIGNLVKAFGVIVSQSKEIESVVDTTADNNTEEYEFTAVEYVLAKEFNSVTIGTNIISLSESDKIEEDYNNMQKEYMSLKDSWVVNIAPFLNGEELAQSVINKAFVNCIKPIDTVYSAYSNNIYTSNLSEMWQVNLIYGGIFDDIGSELGIVINDYRLGLTYNLIIKDADANKLENENIDNIKLWATANQLLYATIYNKATDEANEVDDITQEKYKWLSNAMMLYLDNIYYSMEMY